MTAISVFFEIAAILTLAAGLGAVGHWLRQPLIVSFLVVGVLVGPSGLGLIKSHEQIELMAQIGISLLLFIVGLRLDLHMIRTVGPVALATGLGQVLFTSALGFLMALGFGMSMVGSAYVAVALTFSSTIIIVKLLGDKKEVDSLHGRIAIGFLIVQDIAAILAMIGLTAFGGGAAEQDNRLVLEVLLILGKGAAFLAAIALLMKLVLPRILTWLARYPELLVLFSIAWAVLLGAVGDALGFSKEVGAFLAGVALASTDYREAISARLVTLRDFLLLFFFIDLGARLQLGALGAQLGSAAVFSVFVLVGNPLIVMAIMGYMGYRRRTGFLAGLTVAQISEFSLILGALGVSLGHIDMEAMGLITLVGIVTICASTYMILYSGPLYRRLAPLLAIFERRDPYREAGGAAVVAEGAHDIVLLGASQYGGNVAERLRERKKRILVVDFDPAVVERCRQQGTPAVYGDASDPDFLDQLPLGRARWVLSTIRDRETNLALLRMLAAGRFRARVALTARDEEEARVYSEAGVHVVLRPFSDAAEQAADALTEAMHLLREGVDWPLALRESRLPAGSVFSGLAVGQIPLRAETGVSIFAVSRAGSVYLDVDPDFALFPGDRIVLMGTPENLRRAETFLQQRSQREESEEEPGEFEIAEIELAPDSPLAARSLAELRLRQAHGVTVVGIRRDDQRITSPGATTTVLAGDRLIVLGNRQAVATIKERSPL